MSNATGVSRARSACWRALTVAAILLTAILIFTPVANASYSGSNGQIAIDHQVEDSNGNVVSESVTDVDPVTAQTSEAPVPSGGRHPSWSAGGGSLLYQDSSSGSWILNGAPIAGSSSLFDAVLSPDGQHIAYDKYDSNGCENVYVANADGSNPINVTSTYQATALQSNGLTGCGLSGIYFEHPKWSPDGTQVAVAGDQYWGCSSCHQLYVDIFGATTSDKVPAFQQPLSGFLSGFDFSPTGQYLAVATFQYTCCSSELDRIDVSTGSSVTLASTSNAVFGYTPGGANSAGVEWSPDGKKIAFLSQGTSNQLLLVPYNGGATSALWSTSTSDNPIDLWWTSDPPGVDITSGPDGPTDQRTATFEFTSVTSGVQFQCSLDGGAFTACVSPKTYSNLTDGQHTFEVRAALNGQSPGKASQRQWTVDTGAPVVTIDAAPSGTISSHDVSVSFHGNKPNLDFTCQLDSGPPTPCTSPWEGTGLADGPHTLTISATDQLGNASKIPASATWTISGSSAPPASTCGGPGTVDKAQSGQLVMVGRNGACLHKINVGGRAIWQTDGEATVNGITFTPDPGTKLQLSASGSGSFQATGGVTVGFGEYFSFHSSSGESFDDSSGPDSKWADVLITAMTKYRPNIGGLKIVPSLLLDLSTDNGGTAKITLKVSLPASWASLTPCLGCGEANGGGAAVQVTVNASNDKGVYLASQGSLADLYFGPIHLKDLQLGYDGLTHVWEGGVGIVLPGEAPNNVSRQIRVTLAVGPPPGLASWLCDSGLGCLRKLGLLAQDLNIQLGTSPVFLQKLGGEASEETGSVGGRQQSYLKLSLTGGVSVGPQVSWDGNTICAVCIEGTDAVSFSDPMQFEASGKISLLDFPISGGKATYTVGGPLTLTGNVDLTIDGYGLSAAIQPDTFFQGLQSFNVDTTGDIVLPGFLGGSQHAEAVFSNKGFAACFQYAGAAIGWAADGSGSHALVGSVCDLSPFKATPASALDAHASRIGARVASLPAHRGVRVFAIQGASSAPDGTLVGPGGLSVAVSGGKGQKTGSALSWVDAANRTTYIVLAHAPAGSYRFTPATPEAVTMSSADQLPTPSVKVKMRSARGGLKRLSFRQRGAAGQVLELFEDGHGSARMLKRTTAHSGRLSFRPGVGLGSARSIVAVILQNGFVRRRLTVARYSVNDSPPARPGGFRLGHGMLRWRPASRAATYVVALVGAEGTGTNHLQRATQLRLARGTRKVIVVAVDSIGRPGKAASFRVPKKAKL